MDKRSQRTRVSGIHCTQVPLTSAHGSSSMNRDCSVSQFHFLLLANSGVSRSPEKSNDAIKYKTRKTNKSKDETRLHMRGEQNERRDFSPTLARSVV